MERNPGHTAGLAHCPNVRRVTQLSNSLFGTEIKQATRCPECARSWVEARLGSLWEGGA